MTRSNNSPYNDCCKGKFASKKGNLCDVCDCPLPNAKYVIGKKIRYELDGVTVSSGTKKPKKKSSK